ncbi:PREDICTED: uncharacterized protein LOC109474419 [Branchiostoma belcheri]|uniref:Uncharacterized protein LOC109474419 n=1 Tax=Branchiostoma belcheri TaxID=7741 RepID=A0A6P4Z168_BRABE|nr:PREDICTED: uncharacterized protein LOC109474419 [Branchiostoma belcheri]
MEASAAPTSPTDAEIREKVRSINYSDTGEVTVMGRQIKYNTSMRFEFNTMQLIYYCEAWDIGSGQSDNSGKRESRQGAAEHAIEHLFKRLRKNGTLQAKVSPELMRKIGRAECAEDAERIAASERQGADFPDSNQTGMEAPAAPTSPTDAEIREKVRSINYSDTGEVTVMGRQIKYNTSMRFEFNTMQLIYYCEAWDIGSGQSDNSGKRESRQGAAEHAIEHLMKRLRKNGALQAKVSHAFKTLKHLLTEVKIADDFRTDTYYRLSMHVAESGLTFRAEKGDELATWIYADGQLTT